MAELRASLILTFTLSIGMTLGLTPALAAKTPPTASTPLRAKLMRDLSTRRGAQFDTLVLNWQKNHGTQAVSPLLAIASDSTVRDADRYVALMAAAKIGGKATSVAITGYLKDRSWMIRSGALRALRALKDSRVAHTVLPLLKDPAMVVRSEAVAAVRELRPKGASQALAEALALPANFHAGRALWVPFEAAGALIDLAKQELRAVNQPTAPLSENWRGVARTFVATIEKHSTDVRLVERLTAGLDTIVGRAPATAATLQERLKFWKSKF
jgi:HEAT repeat protein